MTCIIRKGLLHSSDIEKLHEKYVTICFISDKHWSNHVNLLNNAYLLSINCCRYLSIISYIPYIIFWKNTERKAGFGVSKSKLQYLLNNIRTDPLGSHMKWACHSNTHHVNHCTWRDFCIITIPSSQFHYLEVCARHLMNVTGWGMKYCSWDKYIERNIIYSIIVHGVRHLCIFYIVAPSKVRFPRE